MDVKEKDLEALRKAAQGGDVEAQVALGTALAAGAEGSAGQVEALSWLRKAAMNGDTTGMYNMGVMLERGLGTPEDKTEAALWFWQAAEQGDTGARMKLGTMLIKGQGFSPGSAAVRAVEASAEMGNPYAQAFLAKLYLEGVGIKQDDAAAEKLFRLAAERGDESAIFNLGEMMVEGRTEQTSEDEIADWFSVLGRLFLAGGDVVKAFDCLVSIKRINPEHFLAKVLEQEIEKANQDRMRKD